MLYLCKLYVLFLWFASCVTNIRILSLVSKLFKRHIFRPIYQLGKIVNGPFRSADGLAGNIAIACRGSEFAN
jgi:hypothetical protein